MLIHSFISSTLNRMSTMCSPGTLYLLFHLVCKRKQNYLHFTAEEPRLRGFLQHGKVVQLAKSRASVNTGQLKQRQSLLLFHTFQQSSLSGDPTFRKYLGISSFSRKNSNGKVFVHFLKSSYVCHQSEGAGEFVAFCSHSPHVPAHAFQPALDRGTFAAGVQQTQPSNLHLSCAKPRASAMRAQRMCK